MRAPLRIPIAAPCPADWAAMEGDGPHRHCRTCDKTVHDVSALSPDEAEALLAAPGAPPCVRHERRRDGSVLFDLARVTAISGVVVLAACAPHHPEPERLPSAEQHASSAPVDHVQLHVTVLDDSGLGIPGALVTVATEGPQGADGAGGAGGAGGAEGAEGADGAQASWQGVTDDDGIVTMSDVPAGTLRWRVQKQGFPTVERRITVGAESEATITAELNAGDVVMGVIFVSPTGVDTSTIEGGRTIDRGALDRIPF